MMKKVILILFVAGNLFSQEKVIKVEYDFYTEKIIPMKPLSITKSNLYFNKDKSVFVYNKLDDDEEYPEEGSGHLDKIGEYQYIDFNYKDIYERRVMLVRYFFVKDNLFPKWELLDSVTTIDNYKCNLAKTNYYGREYYAWYVIELPFNKGPWKLNGLPGLIIYAYDSKKQISWKAKKINYNIDYSYPKFKDEKFISIKEFFIEEPKIMSNLINFTNSEINMDNIDSENNDASTIEIKGGRLEKDVIDRNNDKRWKKLKKNVDLIEDID